MPNFPPRIQADTAIAHPDPSDRRGTERRLRTFHGLWMGNALRRRRGGRRHSDAHPAGIDWHDAHWLAAAVVIVLLCVADAFLTLALMKQGALEVNPFMAPLVGGAGHGFAYWKLGLTIVGVVTLVVLARSKLFGIIPAGVLLYVILVGYLVLIGYEWRLLMQPPDSVVSYWFGIPLHYPT
jgi:hypothetical protein